jgi:hypothetical protein
MYTILAFLRKVGNIRGGNECMVSLGFRLTEKDWILDANYDSWNNICNSKIKLEKFIEKLKIDADKLKNDELSSKPAPAAAAQIPVNSEAAQLFKILQQLALQTNNNVCNIFISFIMM